MVDVACVKCESGMQNACNILFHASTVRMYVAT